MEVRALGGRGPGGPPGTRARGARGDGGAPGRPGRRAVLGDEFGAVVVRAEASSPAESVYYVEKWAVPENLGEAAVRLREDETAPWPSPGLLTDLPRLILLRVVCESCDLASFLPHGVAAVVELYWTVWSQDVRVRLSWYADSDDDDVPQLSLAERLLQKASSGSVQAKRQDSFNFDAVSKMVNEVANEKPATASASAADKPAATKKAAAPKKPAAAAKKSAPAKKKNKKAEDSDVSFGDDEDVVAEVAAKPAARAGRNVQRKSYKAVSYTHLTLPTKA